MLSPSSRTRANSAANCSGAPSVRPAASPMVEALIRSLSVSSARDCSGMATLACLGNTFCAHTGDVIAATIMRATDRRLIDLMIKLPMRQVPLCFEGPRPELWPDVGVTLFLQLHETHHTGSRDLGFADEDHGLVFRLALVGLCVATRRERNVGILKRHH